MQMNATDIDDDQPISLAKAAKLFFDGALTKSSLRTEARKGNLEIFRIANKDFVTRRGIRRMLEKCRVEKSRPDCGSAKIPEPGSSRTEASVSPQDALRAMLKAQKKNSTPTSAKNGKQRATVLPLKPSSAKS
jgi:hypothetical protein